MGVFAAIFLMIITALAGSAELDVPGEKLEAEDGIINIGDRAGWLFRAGDDSTWADPEASLEHWQPAPWAIDMGYLPEEWDGIGWYRTTVRVDSALAGSELSFYGNTFGALEVFVNGERVGGAGRVTADQDAFEPAGYFEPIQFSASDSQELHIAFRFAHHDEKLWENSPFDTNLFLGPVDEVSDAYAAQQTNNTNRGYVLIWIIGFFVALALLHLILYGFYPADRANLIFGGMMLTLAVLIGNIATYYMGTYEAENFYRYISFESLPGVVFGFLSLLFTCYIIKRRAYVLLGSLAVSGLLIIGLIQVDSFTFRPLVMIYALISVTASVYLLLHTRIVQKMQELNIILVSYLFFFMLSVPRLLYVAAGVELPLSQSLYPILASFLVLPVGYSTFLGQRVASTNRDLKKKLQENKKLSDEKLKAEQEKQKVINRQKEELERQVEERTVELQARNESLQQANEEIQTQRDEVIRARDKLQNALDDLEAAQNQLVQQEKLASLGQLTAGIAHEIKNPLNFVHNFSELSFELIEEAREETEQIKQKLPSDQSDSDLPDLLDDIGANLEKIHQHGERANQIIHSMLQHSRGGSGKAEPVDLNAVVREYVNLAYHGMRAGEQPINVEISYELTEALPEVSINTEDISRVIINLCNNAFDAMYKKLADKKSGSFNPHLRVRTNKDKNDIKLEVVDNGCGMTEDEVRQVFEPFFTTKQGREGTGLGMSISNDIIQAHGGTMEVESEVDHGTCMIVRLPVVKDI